MWLISEIALSWIPSRAGTHPQRSPGFQLVSANGHSLSRLQPTAFDHSGFIPLNEIVGVLVVYIIAESKIKFKGSLIHKLASGPHNRAVRRSGCEVHIEWRRAGLGVRVLVFQKVFGGSDCHRFGCLPVRAQPQASIW
ncbi:hypothetical protein BDM02DRAFT_3124371 [Thelephora ganbajun]|uniref:Uncharacterized protein n=1 Tax=Thelephora ganbajun TaxID=370292 RepID=A0ACB6YZJ2_THEGA|nr:hypothetical protein BDM02DRAFT_3124371 [Thelephora ganbajun]